MLSEAPHPLLTHESVDHEAPHPLAFTHLRVVISRLALAKRVGKGGGVRAHIKEPNVSPRYANMFMHVLCHPSRCALIVHNLMRAAA